MGGLRERTAGAAALVMVVLAISGCGGAASDQTSATATPVGASANVGDLRITNAIARISTNNVSAMYFTVQNAGDAEDRLVSASTDVSGNAMLHQEVTEGNSSTMVMIASISIPANSTVDLIANHYHIMLTGLKSPLNTGDKVTATLSFQNAGKVTLTVPVVPYTTNP